MLHNFVFRILVHLLFNCLHNLTNSVLSISFSHVQPYSSGAASGGHPGGADQTLSGYEQWGLPVHISKYNVCVHVCIRWGPGVGLLQQNVGSLTDI